VDFWTNLISNGTYWFLLGHSDSNDAVFLNFIIDYKSPKIYILRLARPWTLSHPTDRQQLKATIC